MVAIKFYFQIISVFLLLILTNSKDVSTQSNYDIIKMNHLSGEFKIDFEKKIVHGSLIYNLTAESAGEQIIFDTNKLNITKVYKIDTKEGTTEDLTYTSEDGEEYLGKKLIIELKFEQNDNVQIKIEYKTTHDGDSAQFLQPEQTFGKSHPYFFTVSEMILGRSLFPCQDTPAVKFKFDLTIIVPKDLKGMISGILVGEEEYSDSNYKAFNYKQEIPVPSYLVSLAAGNIAEKAINDTISIYSEPEYLDAAYNESSEDIPKVLDLANDYIGEYKWGKLNLLVLPKSFPYSGIENPNLIFLSPCVINGDKSLIDIMVHMITHQWAGNLVTQENWSDFWINAGVALFLRRKVMGLLKDDAELARMDGYQGMFYIQYYINYFDEEHKDFTSLHPNLEGKNPEDYFIDIPYEKGYNFIYYIETLIGEDLMQQFFKEYFAYFEFQSITYETFRQYFNDFCQGKVSNETLDIIDWDEWILKPGNIPEKIDEENKYKNQSEKIFAKILEENFDGLEEEFNNLPTISKVYIFSMFSYGENYFLTEKQHKFFTETLKLYENQNFLTTVNYLYMILQKSDKFLDHELDCLTNILSNYSVMDYLSGLYPEFYKRDEIKAMEILEQNKEFYHPLMYNMALEEIEEAKNEFPILELNISGDVVNLPMDDIPLNVSEYKETLGEIELNDSVYLVSEKEQYELICFIKNADIQYCKLKNISSFIPSGNYHIKVSERKQKRNYAIKAFESKNFTINQLLDIEKIDKSYYFDFKDENYFLINLNFVEDTFDKVEEITAIFDNKNEFKLVYKRDEKNCSLIYELNKTLIESEYIIYKEYTKYQVNFLSKNNESFLNIDIYIKDSEYGDESEEITDVSTLSNYKKISIQYISGEFKADFDNKIINGSLLYNLTAKEDGNQIIFDTNALKIYHIYQVINDVENNVDYSFGNKDEKLGQPLIMNIDYKQNDYIGIKIVFSTTQESIAVKFLSPNQTFGQNQPYMFTQSKLILGRSLFPCQDTPAVKFKYDLNIIVPKDLKGMISGIFVGETEYSDTNYKAFNYKLDIPIPSYLLALAAGNITENSINENISVFSEPDFVGKAYEEVYENISKVIELTENYTGQKYEWGKFSILVLPRSFPFSGTENPCLTFLSPSLINGDKELVDNIFHKMIHSWSGNLVTNEAWSEFWLNEGITTFLTRKVLSILTKDKELSRMDGLNGQYFIKESVNFFGDEYKEYTKLRPNLTGVSPDDVYSDIPFEKGYNFIYYLEKLIGEEKMEKFFKSYFEHFKYQSINYFHFKNYFIRFCKNNEISNEILQKINWTEWIFTPGGLPKEINETNKYKEKAEEVLDKIRKEELDNLATEFENLETSCKFHILVVLCDGEGILTEKQHKFFTETLKLYEKQNFLMTTYYYKLILQKTTIFLEHEFDSLLEYLKSNAAQDYMSGVYGAFYKRDEVKAVETLENLKNFYHVLMYNMAKDDIETAKNEFPIMEINVNKDNKYYYPYEDVFDLDVENYKDELGQINLIKNIYLVLNEQTKLELNCTIKSADSKQCKLNDIKSLESTGEYSIKVTERVQELKYAIKVFESNKFEIRQFLDRKKTKNSYTYDLGKEDNLKIILNLNETINFDLPVYFNNQEELKLKCAINNIDYECEINKTFCATNCKVDATGKNYKVNILSKSKESFFDIDVLIKNTTSSQDTTGGGGNNTLVIVLPCVIVGVLIIAVIIFFICRKKRQTLTTDEVSKELVSVGLRDDDN